MSEQSARHFKKNQVRHDEAFDTVGGGAGVFVL